MIRMAIIGIGHLGNFHAQKAQQSANCRLCYLVEPDVSKHAALRERFEDVEIMADMADIDAAQVDACVIAAPTKLHAALTRGALENGWHALVEKPLTDSYQASQELVSLAEQKGLVLQVGMTERFNPAVQAALDIADRPRYMVSERLGLFGGRSGEIDVIFDLMVHDLDIMLALVPSPVAEIRAVGVPLLTEQVDMANVRLEFEDGTVAQLTASRASLAKTRIIRLFTMSQYLSVDCDTRTVKAVKRLPAPEGQSWPQIMPQAVTVNSEQDPLAAQFENFMAAVNGQGTPMVSGAQALPTLKIAEEIISAIHTALAQHKVSAN